MSRRLVRHHRPRRRSCGAPDRRHSNLVGRSRPSSPRQSRAVVSEYLRPSSPGDTNPGFVEKTLTSNPCSRVTKPPCSTFAVSEPYRSSSRRPSTASSPLTSTPKHPVMFIDPTYPRTYFTSLSAASLIQKGSFRWSSSRTNYTPSRMLGITLSPCCRAYCRVGQASQRGKDGTTSRLDPREPCEVRKASRPTRFRVRSAIDGASPRLLLYPVGDARGLDSHPHSGGPALPERWASIRLMEDSSADQRLA